MHGPGAAAPAPAPAPLAETTPVAAPAAAAPASGDGRSASNQGEITQLQARLAEVQGGAQRYAQGQQQLRRAEELLKSAKGSLTITQVSGGTEMIQDMRIGMRGGGMFGPRRGVGRAMDRRNDLGHNVVEMATIQKASKAVKEAGVAMQAARQVLPNLPYIQPANVQAAMGGVMFNALLAPGLIGDMMQNAKVRKAKDEVNEMHVQVVQALDWCTNNMQAAQSEAAQINASLQAKMAAAH